MNRHPLIKKILLVMALLVGLAVALFFYSAHADQERFRQAANPCERDCIQDSGGLEDCRKYCVGHPLTYGPATPELKQRPQRAP
jgi:hypothetical protein